MKTEGATSNVIWTNTVDLPQLANDVSISI